MKVVLDANQFVSGLLVSQGNPAKILDAWRAGRFEVLVSKETLDELARVLRYPKIQRRLKWSPAQHEAFLERLRDVSTLVEVREPVRVVNEDPSDDAYWRSPSPGMQTSLSPVTRTSWRSACSGGSPSCALRSS